MKIAHLLLRPRFSGAETLVRDLAHLQGATDEVVVASLDPSEPDFSPVLERLGQEERISLHIPDRKLGRAARLAWVVNLLRRHRPDVVFAHSQIPSWYLGLALRLAPGRMVKVMHSADGERFRLIDRLTLPKGCHVVGVNPSHLESFVGAAPGWGLVPHYVPNGIQLSRFREASAAVEPEPGLVVMVGRVGDMKGQCAAIAALATIDPSVRPRLEVAGILEDRAYLEKARLDAERFGVSCTFLGGRDDIPAFLARASAILMPSNREAHPIAYLEALASGRPLVANDLPVFRDQGRYEGVWYERRDDSMGFGAAIRTSLAGPRLHERDLSRFDIRSTAREYLRLGMEATR